MQFLRSLAAGIVLLGSVHLSAMAQDVKTYTSKRPFDEVRFELGNAVTQRGFAAHSEGNLSKMLERTGADVGATAVVYKNAEFITFCSARYTRKMVEADPANAGNCPFQVFAYETMAKPGEVVVGFRRLGTPSAASRAAFVEIEAMLDGLVKDAVK
jgi:uncharacterized protein (DUF302 family)